VTTGVGQRTTVVMPLRLPSLANCRLHWRALHRLKVDQQFMVYGHMLAAKLPPLPATVTLTRVGPRKLDSDNLAGAFKFVRDQIAGLYGVDDGSPLYVWQYGQEVGREYAIRVAIEGKGA
jgi:hypothetical protein